MHDVILVAVTGRSEALLQEGHTVCVVPPSLLSQHYSISDRIERLVHTLPQSFTANFKIQKFTIPYSLAKKCAYVNKQVVILR